MRANLGSKISARVSQRGQALILILVFTVITTVLGLAVLSNGLLISEKMEMQNAADAAAFSVSTAEARDLNFSSYTNRAMVANEVGIAQILSFMSWMTMVEKLGPTLALYMSPLIALLMAFPPTTAIGNALEKFFTVFSRVTANIARVMQRITKLFTTALGIINTIYSAAQRVFHLGTFFLSIYLLDKIVGDNDFENYAGADQPSFSGFGLMAIAGHFLTHYPDLAKLAPNDSFVKTYSQDKHATTLPLPLNSNLKPNKPEQKAGMERFASMINKSRDRFTTDRAGGWTQPLEPPIFPAVGVNICYLCTPKIGPIPAFKTFEFKFGLDIDLNRRGGAELRYKKKGTGTGQTQNYAWTSVDVTSIDFTPVIRLTVFNISESIEFPGIGVPAGVGATQAAFRDAAVGSRSLVPVPNMRYRVNRRTDKISAHNYGNSPGTSWLVWASGWQEVPSPFAGGKLTTRGPSQTIGDPKYNLYNKYRLSRYNDSKPSADQISLAGKTFGFESPFLIIGLTKDRDELFDNSNPRPRGRMAPADGHADDEVGVIAKSEVFFSRPSDVSYLRRADGKTEYASAFNPYWSARLVDTSILDRVMALGLQQEQLWLPSINIGNPVDDFANILAWATP